MQINQYTKQKQTDRHRKKLPKGEGIYLKFGINKYKLLYIQQKNNKDLLYNTGNNIQYLVINYNGKESEIYIYIIESLCYPPDTNFNFKKE